MKKILRIMMLASSIFFMTVAGWAADTSAEIDSIKTEVDVTRNQSNNNNSRIQALEAVTQDLQNQINTIELIPGPQGPEGPQGPQGEQGPPGVNVAAGQVCPPGSYVTGFGSDGSLMCSGNPQDECPCWTAEELEYWSGYYPGGGMVTCTDHPPYPDHIGTTIQVLDGSDRFLQVYIDPMYVPGMCVAHGADFIPPLERNEGAISLSQAVRCRELLVNSSIWNTNSCPNGI